MTGNKFTALLPLLLGAASCAPDPGIVTLPSGLEMSWDSMPHRLSQLEITSNLAAGEETLTAQNDGGDFGPFDLPRARYDYVRAEHPGLCAYQDSIHFVIAPPTEPDNTTPFEASQELVLDTDQLETNESVAIFLRGFRIETDLYDTPPAFQTDPEQPYDPSMGFTTSGFGISLSQPRKEGDKWKSIVTVRNGLAAGDRPDMNAAITEALSWLRVDYLVVGGPSSVVVSTAETQYDLSYPTFGSQTEHPHAPIEQQQLTFEPKPQRELVGYGLTGFNIAVNVPGKYADDCVPVNEEVNAWGDEISGPSRYLKSFTARIHSVEADSQTGQASAALDLHFSNSSVVREIGSLCVGAQGTVAILRSSSSETTPWVEAVMKARFESGELHSAPFHP